MSEERPRYHIISLVEIKVEMGAHYSKAESETYEGQCYCGEFVGQDVNKCPYCDMPIVWKGSALWKNTYGSPTQTVQRLDVYPPIDDDGIRLCEFVGVAGFKTKSDLTDWNRGVNRPVDVRGIVDYIIRRHSSHKERTRYGALNHALNMVRKKTRETPRRAKGRERVIPDQRVRDVTMEDLKGGIEMG